MADEMKQKGTRIIVRMPGHQPRHGVIVGQSRDWTCWWVLIDGRQTRQRFHKDFVQEDTK